MGAMSGHAHWTEYDMVQMEWICRDIVEAEFDKVFIVKIVPLH